MSTENGFPPSEIQQSGTPISSTNSYFNQGSNQFPGAEGFSLALLELQKQIQQHHQSQNLHQNTSSTLPPSTGRRRVWIKREGSVPTTVFVDSNDIIGMKNLC